MTVTSTSDTTPAAPERIGPSAGELEHAAALYRDALPPGRLQCFDISRLDRIGRSVQAASFIGESEFVNDGFGYGADEAEAIVGALGEISETAHVDRALAACRTECASHREMACVWGADAVLDPLSLCLPAGSDADADTQLLWVPVNRHGDEAEGWAPMECVAFSPSQWTARAAEPGNSNARILFRPITCGLGAGTSLAQALSHGVLELLQRDGNCTSFRAMDRGVRILLDDIEDVGLSELLDRLRRVGVEPMAKLASTEFGLVNLYVVGRSAEDGLPIVQTACGEAVHANAERALRKALLEFAAARSRKSFMHGPLEPIRRIAPDGYLEAYAAAFDTAGEEARALSEMRRWLGLTPRELVESLSDTVFAEREQVALSALPSAADTEVRAANDRLADIAGRLDTAGIGIWYFDASPSAEGPRVIKAIAPGLEGETMSYARIGARGAARLEARGSALVCREPGEGRVRIRMTARAEAELGPRWFDAALADRIVGGAYPLYREPSSHAVALADVTG